MRSVQRRGIRSLLGSGGVNASAGMRCVCVCLLHVYDAGDCILVLLVYVPFSDMSSSNQSKQGYDKYGSATNCDCCGRDVGPNKMCVWQGEGGGGGDVAGGGDSETEIGVEDDGQGGESDTEGVPSGEEGGVVESEGEGDGGDVSGSGGESEGEGESV